MFTLAGHKWCLKVLTEFLVPLVNECYSTALNSEYMGAVENHGNVCIRPS